MHLHLVQSFLGLNLKIVSLRLMPAKAMHRRWLQPRETFQVSLYSQWFFSGPLSTLLERPSLSFLTREKWAYFKLKLSFLSNTLKMPMAIRKMQGVPWTVMLASTFREAVLKIESCFTLFHTRKSEENSDSAPQPLKRDYW